MVTDSAAALQEIANAEKAAEEQIEAKRKKGPRVAGPKATGRTRKAVAKETDAIDVDASGDEGEAEAIGEAEAGVGRARLRELLAATKARMAGGGDPPRTGRKAVRCSWWEKAKRYRLCSGRDPPGDWDTTTSWSGDPSGSGRPQGYKRWRCERLDEETERFWFVRGSIAGSSRAELPTEGKRNQEEKEEGKGKEIASPPARLSPHQEAGQEEKEEEREKKAGDRNDTRPRWIRRVWGQRLQQRLLGRGWELRKL